MTSMPLGLPDEARIELNRYLRRMRAALRGYPSVDVDEIERDVRSHIDAALEESPSPVTARHVRDVLDRLGSPSQWVPPDDLPLWRKAVLHFFGGTDDWRLTYLTGALCVAGFLLMGRAGALLFLASVGTARATLALLDELGEPVGARRWLIYPPLVLTYVTMSTVLILLPPTLVATAGDPTVRADAEAWLPAPFWLGLSIGIVGSAGIWWSLLGLLLARHTDVARTVFWPLAEWFERRHALSLALVGLALVVIAGLGLGLIFWAF